MESQFVVPDLPDGIRQEELPMVAMPPLRRIAEWDNALDEPGVTHLVDFDCVWMGAWTPRLL
jgi:hypothetical protein